MHRAAPPSTPLNISRALARLSEVANETQPNSPMTKFLDGFIAGNEQAMREAARAMVAEKIRKIKE